MKSKLFRRPTVNGQRKTALSPEGHLSSRVAALSAAKQPLSRGAASSRAAALSALLLLFALPAAAQDFDLEVCGENKPFSLVSVEPAEGAGVITYEWYENGSTITGNEASICITEGRPVGTYAYVRKASSDACPGEVASNTYVVKVNTLPSLTISPISAYTTPGVGVTLTATASQCNGCTYLWSTGETTSSIMAGASNADVVYYSCTVTPDEGGCTATTAAATVTVVEPPPGDTPPVTLCPSCCWDDAAATWVYCFVTTNAYPFENTTNTTTQWSGAGTLYFSDAASDRNGKGNTSAISSTGTSAVQLCKDLGTGWYLPAYEEMLHMTTTRADMLLNGLPGFPILTSTGVSPEASWHWSSSEYHNPLPGRYQYNWPTMQDRAVLVNPIGQLTSNTKTKTIYYVRCAWQP